MNTVLLSSTALDVAALLASVGGEESGAVISFNGTARAGSSIAAGKRVVRLEYEAYEEMARRVMDDIVADAAARFPLDGVALAHRSGSVELGQSALFCAVATAHRAEAFEACRFIVERVKAELPVWKREIYTDGSEYVGRGA
jgi:molybdopterin synthase catalytic subunit